MDIEPPYWPLCICCSVILQEAWWLVCVEAINLKLFCYPKQFIPSPEAPGWENKMLFPYEKPLTYQWDPGSAPSGLCRFLCNGCLGSCSSPAFPLWTHFSWGYWKTIHSLSFNLLQKQKLAPSFLSTALQETSQDWILQPWRLVKWVTLLVLHSLKCLIGFAFQEEILELKSFLSTWSHYNDSKRYLQNSALSFV